jgi:predicted MFS family arabinose efflux permease
MFGIRVLGQRYAFVVLGAVFCCLLVSAGLRSTPGVLILPLEQGFGWSRDVISFSAAMGIFLYGLVGPFAAAFMERYGLRRTMIGALCLMAASTGASSLMSEPWHLVLSWGVLSGLGSGCLALVLGATVVNRWFATNRGLMMGVLTASTASGTLVFLPALAAIAETYGWQSVVLTIATACALLVPVVFFLVPERPYDAGLAPYGATHPPQPPEPRTGLLDLAVGSLVVAARTRTFWYLFVTFFICGFTTNGLVGTHLIAFCGDMGISQIHAASLLALMGIFDLVGTTLSGWLTDRFDPRRLLFVYYAVRGLSLLYLPFSDFSVQALTVFAVFYGLDWIATVPPTLRLTSERFGDRRAPAIFGWIVVGHQIGAASAAYLGGYLRTVQGNYFDMFLLAGATAVFAAFVALMVRRGEGAAQPA